MPDKKNWRQKKTKELYANRYFRLRVDECEMADGRTMPNYFVLDFPDWVHVIALNRRGEILIVDQYRYPGEGWFFELPGGSTHPDRKEDPLIAAQRELVEETGFTSSSWQYLGSHFPNPALMNNRCHVFLALDCERTCENELDPYEILELREMPLAQFEDQLFASEKLHAMMLGSYMMFKRHIEKDKTKGAAP
jgi:8-oxo-dGTP pyrophosphatase MutT (NUDIX family)